MDDLGVLAAGLEAIGVEWHEDAEKVREAADLIAEQEQQLAEARAEIERLTAPLTMQQTIHALVAIKAETPEGRDALRYIAAVENRLQEERERADTLAEQVKVLTEGLERAWATAAVEDAPAQERLEAVTTRTHNALEAARKIAEGEK